MTERQRRKPAPAADRFLEGWRACQEALAEECERRARLMGSKAPTLELALNAFAIRRFPVPKEGPAHG